MKVGNRNVNCIRRADDAVLIADTNQNLQELTPALDEANRTTGLRISFANTNVWVITKRRGRVDVEVDLHQRRVKQVDIFKYLGCTVGESVVS